ncbi:hypothetical protein Glove_157g70 [Diversispora epigaea]|uniref:F-box domain-containing protein n=1 Tax=Diversispora epigaea TaxID=1348612 RepID=A0A397IWE3_9GLOM|nr:hypothetical protein Glove_157g70 [Diversispora epigaea]
MIENFNDHAERKVKNEFKYLKACIIDLEYGMRMFHKKLENVVDHCNYMYSDNYDYNSDTSDSNCSDILPDVIAVKKIHESKDLGSIHSKPKKKRNKNKVYNCTKVPLYRLALSSYITPEIKVSENSRASVKTLKTMYTNLLDLIPSELIPSITKNLPIQDLKNCCSLDNIWKTETSALSILNLKRSEIRTRLALSSYITPEIKVSENSRASVKTLKTMYTNLLDLIPSELIPSITKNLPIQDLKNCCSLDNIWKTEVIREIRKRLIVDCTFIDSKTTVKALIDPKSQYNSISKALAKKMDLYISRNWGSRYPAVEKLGVGATNAGKKVMVRGWTDKENISVSLPNIFELKPPSYLGKSYMCFVVIDKPEYDLVLGSTIDEHDGKYWETNEEKRIYYARNNIDIVSPSLYTFYELLFPKFTTINSDGEVILIEFSDQNVENTSIDLSEYYDSEYSETESESSDSKTESEFSDSETESEFSDFISVLRSFRDNSLNYRLV